VLSALSPIRLPANSLEFYGENHSRLCQNTGDRLYYKARGATRGNLHDEVVSGNGRGLVSNYGKIHFIPIYFSNGLRGERECEKVRPKRIFHRGFFKRPHSRRPHHGSKRANLMRATACFVSVQTGPQSRKDQNFGGLVTLAACPRSRSYGLRVRIELDKVPIDSTKAHRWTSTLCGSEVSRTLHSKFD